MKYSRKLQLKHKSSEPGTYSGNSNVRSGSAGQSTGIFDEYRWSGLTDEQRGFLLAMTKDCLS